MIFRAIHSTIGAKRKKISLTFQGFLHKMVHKTQKMDT